MLAGYAALIKTNSVLMATIIAFGFVFTHSFEDGNGRIHRYLFHHVLAEKGFVPKGLIFPVSAVILERNDGYRKTLEHYSKPRLGLIEWRPIEKNNVEVLNETLNLYRYFDATKQAGLSKRKRAKEFEELTEKQIQAIEAKYLEMFG